MNKNISDDKELAFLPKNNQQPAVDKQMQQYT